MMQEADKTIVISGLSSGYNVLMDKVALAVTIFVVLICALIAFVRVYFGNQPWTV